MPLFSEAIDTFMRNETHRDTPRARDTSRQCLVYVIGSYPSLTKTFIDREIRNLRAWGKELHVLSIRRPTDAASLSAEQRQLGQGVIYLLPAHLLKLVLANLCFALRLGTYMRTLLYLLSRPHPNLKARVMTLLHFGEGVYAAYVIRRQLVKGQAQKHAGLWLHAHFADRAALVALVASRLLDVPYSLTAHANDIYVSPVLLYEKISQAEFTTTCTKYNYEYLQQMMGEPYQTRLHLAYHGIDLSRYEPETALRIQAAESDCPLLLSVGRLTEKKGFRYLIAACKQLKDRGYNYRCQIVGEGPQRADLELEIARCGLQNRIELCGAIPHETVVEKYRQARLFVLPCVVAQDGDRDGIPNVLIEAMAMQIPVISTRHSGIPELVQDGTNGLLVPTNDVDALYRALAQLLDDPQLCQELGQNARMQAQAAFDVQRNTRRLFELFDRAAAS